MGRDIPYTSTELHSVRYDFIKCYTYLQKKCIYGTTSLHLPESRHKRLLLLCSGPCPHYMMILLPSEKNACMQYKYKCSQLEKECIRDIYQATSLHKYPKNCRTQRGGGDDGL